MICPRCQHGESKVLETRSSGMGIRRRRQCLECEFRFTTHERIEVKMPLVVKKDGSREPFDREKVFGGFRMACRKRPVSAVQIEEATERIEQWALARALGEVGSAEIGRAVLAELKELDQVGYLRFASVYFEVGSPIEFMQLLDSLLDSSLPPSEEPPGRQAVAEAFKTAEGV